MRERSELSEAEGAAGCFGERDHCETLTNGAVQQRNQGQRFVLHSLCKPQQHLKCHVLIEANVGFGWGLALFEFILNLNVPVRDSIVRCSPCSCD